MAREVRGCLGEKLPPDRHNSSLSTNRIGYHADLKWLNSTIPFTEEADYGLGCDQCYKINSSTRKHQYKAHKPTTYCKCNIIAVKHKNSLTWEMSIRLCPDLSLSGSYTLCKFNTENDACRRTKNCTYPHNLVEQSWWNLEAANRINTVSFRDYLQFERLISLFGGRFVFICKQCYLSSKKVTFVDQDGHCPNHHIPKENKLLAQRISSRFKPIFPRPTWFAQNFRLCKYMEKCNDNKNGVCYHAHSEIELAIWSVDGQLDDGYRMLVDWSQRINPQPQTAKRVAKVQENGISNVLTPQSVKCRGNYCEDCSLQFRTKQDLITHNNSTIHTDNLQSDQHHQWNFRQPSWTSNKFSLCDKHLNGRLCSFSNMPDSLNYCPEAHSQLELLEWESRKQWRELNKRLSNEIEKCCLMNDLILSGSLKVEERHPGISIECDKNLHQISNADKYSTSWKFIVTSNSSKLQNLILLNHDDRLEFSFLKPNDNSKHQLLTGYSVQELMNDGNLKYTIDVNFTSEKPGFYSQTLILEFNNNIVIGRKISVGMKTNIDPQIDDVIIDDISDDETATLDFTLSKKYPQPSKPDFMKAKYDACFDINMYNYKHKMHKLINSEEYTRQLILSQYNMETEINITNELKGGTFLYAQNEELFGSIYLKDDLCEDTDKGKLLLESVKSTIIQPMSHTKSDKVYEIPIIRLEKFSGRHKNNIYIIFNSRIVEDLDLKTDTKLKVNVRFKMDRGLFCRMHYAVDVLQNLDLIFPPVSKLNVINWNEEDIKISRGRLSEDQLKAVRHIVARKDYSPPLIVYGPFGTGKTETLAESTKILLSARKCRILICTFTNSAADIYFSTYLDEFLQSKGLVNLTLRIYHKDRRINTVPESCRPYILYSQETNSFKLPTREDILNRKLIVTTVETAIELTTLKVNGEFTHIFIDEAAQAMECQLLIPLSLANDKTCIVLTGDHRQMNPTIYSKDAQKQGFGRSLLERLHNYYTQVFQTNDNMINLFLNRNYRSEQTLLRFISDTFYGGSNVLICKSGDIGTPMLQSMNFYCVSGQEIQDKNSTSFYNESEADIISEGVEYMVKHWPPTWGKVSLESIQVVAPYSQQVNLIRSKLRKKRLGRVSVERIYNIQGKQFRALFISTVRTTALLDSASLVNCLESDDTEIGEYAFLTDANMLNTAFTRAQSYVAVVGDATALCCIGQCRGIWKKFINHCNGLGTLYPEIFEDIKKRVQEIENSVGGQRLQEKIDQRKLQQMTVPQNNHSKTIRNDWKSGKLSDKIKSKRPLPSGMLRLPTKKSSISIPSATGKRKLQHTVETPFKYGTQMEKLQDAIDDTDDWDDFKLKPDEIIQKLVETSLEAGDLKSDTTSALNESVPLKISYKVKEERGHAVIYPMKSVIHDKGRHVLTKDDEIQDDEGLETSDEEGENYERDNDSPIRRLQSKSDLKILLDDQPHKYKKCIIEINSEFRRARLISPEPNMTEIILNRAGLGRALEHDLVVVEILTDITDTTEEMKGKVVGILERYVKLRYKVFICRTDPINTSVMIPIDRNMLPIINLTLQDSDKKHKDGKVVMYNFTKEGRRPISFKGYESIDPTNPNGKLFLVRILKFSKSCRLPLGIVFDTHTIGDNLISGSSIIDNQYHITTKFSSQILQLCKPFEKRTINTSVYPHRKDFTDMTCFTIDPPKSQDLDDALSLTVENDLYVVGIHIADVSHFVTKDSALDSAAFKRCFTYYRIDEEPVHMLPKTLSTTVCSLLPNVNRLTTSILLYLDDQFHVVRAEPHKAIINSKRRLTYEEAQVILNSNENHDNVSSSIQTLNYIADIWRERRVGSEWVYKDVEFTERHHAQAHSLVAEIMIMANHHVASILNKAFPDCCPIRIHGPPKEKPSNDWKREHLKAAFNSVTMLKPYCSENCPKTGHCKCLEEYAEEQNFENTADLCIPLDTMEMLSEAADGGDWQLFQYLFLSPENYPQMAVALVQMRKMQERSYYVCSRDASSPFNAHYGLKVTPYTHFTSPIRRYVDIIVHRMLEASILKVNSPYTVEEMDRIMWKCNSAFRNSKNYERSMFKLHCSLAFEKKPLIYYTPIESITEDKISIIFPTIPDFTGSENTIKMSLLAPSGIPDIREDKSAVVSWRERIYNLQSNTLIDGNAVTELVSPKKNVLVNCGKWQSLLDAVCNNDIGKAIAEFWEIMNSGEDQTNFKWFHDLAIEAQINKKLIHFVRFSSEYQIGSKLKIQMAPALNRGIFTPKVQLLYLSAQLSLCLEHRRDPIMCFTELASRKASREKYNSIEEYKSGWLPVLSMEAATSAVKGQEQVFIHNVEIEWTTVSQNGSSRIEGVFTLPLEFCKKRGLNFLSDYVCVRYKDLNAELTTDVSDKIRNYIDHKEKVTFVCHCIIRDVRSNSRQVDDKETGNVLIRLKLQQCSMVFPQHLLDNNCKYTLEVIPKSLPQRRVEIAVNMVDKGTKLAVKIALGAKIKDKVNHTDIDKLMAKISSIDLNEIQLEVIKRALKQPFTLIQGPPGTGKTVTGVHLTTLFCERNRNVGTLCQILYCGPSNKSVDVVAEKLLNLKERCPYFIRVYGERIEQTEFPLPRDIVPHKKKLSIEVSKNEGVRNRALHHMIRLDHNTFAEEIKKFDEMFRLENADEIEDKTIDEYKKVVNMAKIEELKRAEVLLVTCDGSSRHLLREHTNITQIIIDEAAMCTEPESMIPIIAHHARNIVLIGDHQQLQPIVVEEKAKHLGLQTSLFERYSEKSSMLETQYRMHKGIMEFPSNTFYDGNLKCGTKKQRKPVKLDIWPNGRNNPIVFCHNEGIEDALTVATEDGSEMSKFNQFEAEFVVNAAINLVENHGVMKKDIVILSQYRAQCATIKKLLKEKKVNDMTVLTVIASQGSEWDFVIFSTVRSQPQDMIDPSPSKRWLKLNLGFIMDAHQVNVAITRARWGNIIIGNKHLLSCDPVWNKLIEYYQDQDLVVEADTFHLTKHQQPVITPRSAFLNNQTARFSTNLTQSTRRNPRPTTLTNKTPTHQTPTTLSNKTPTHQTPTNLSNKTPTQQTPTNLSNKTPSNLTNQTPTTLTNQTSNTSRKKSKLSKLVQNIRTLNNRNQPS